MRSGDYAHLADHSYDRNGTLKGLLGETTEIGGIKYKVIAHSDRPSGYQGTIYQRVDSGEFIVAHRGTEFDRQKLNDLVKTDGGMVVTRSNRQAEDALALTQMAMDMAENRRTQGLPASVTTTGHSLGGTLAQISAHHFGIKGETFNAFGAVSLDRRIGPGGYDVINHVMAADVVSAGSAHYGQVRVYADALQLSTLHRAGYANTSNPLDPRSPVVAAGLALTNDTHAMHQFLPVDGAGRRDTSILDRPEAREAADRFHPMIHKYRQDIETIRIGATMGLRSGRGWIEDAIDAWNGPLPAGTPSRLPPQSALGEPASLMPGAPTGTTRDLSQPGHPLHARYLAVYDGVCAIDREHGREPDAGSCRMAAALAAESTSLRNVAGVVMGADRQRLFAIDTLDPQAPVRNRVHVDIATAYAQPMEASHDRWQALTAQAPVLQPPGMQQAVADSRMVRTA